jgi:hypothetical protein
MKRKNIYFIITIAIFAVLIVSCYYDSEEALYPSLNSSCDTTNVTFTATIVPILNGNCTSCHSGSVPSGGILLTSYSVVQPYVANGTLMNALTGTGVPKMPPSGALTDCRINQFRIWIKNGSLNN